MSRRQIHPIPGNGMNEEETSESKEKVKRQTLNVYLLIIGVIVAGVSFAWHIIALLF